MDPQETQRRSQILKGASASQLLKYRNYLRNPDKNDPNRPRSPLRAAKRHDVEHEAHKRLLYLEKHRKEELLAEESIFDSDESDEYDSEEEREELENLRENNAIRIHTMSGLADPEHEERDEEGELVNPELTDPDYYKTHARPRSQIWDKGFSKPDDPDHPEQADWGIPPEEWASTIGRYKGMDAAEAQALLAPQSSSTTPVDPVADRARRAAAMGLQDYNPPPILPVKRTKAESVANRDKRKKRKRINLVAVNPDPKNPAEEDEWIA